MNYQKQHYRVETAKHKCNIWRLQTLTVNDNSQLEHEQAVYLLKQYNSSQPSSGDYTQPDKLCTPHAANNSNMDTNETAE